MSTGDEIKPTDATENTQQQETSEALSKVVQDLNAPGSKIDQSNGDLSALNENLQKNNILPYMEITGMQANADHLPSGQHTEAVQLNEGGQQHNATYNPDTQQLSYERPETLKGSKGPENVSIDMLTGQTTITAAGDGNTTRTTTVDQVGDVKGPTVVTEGKPGEAPGKVRSIEYNDGTGDISQLKRTFDYDASGNVTGFRDVNGQDVSVPPDAKDAKVDPKTGELTFTQADGVQVAYSSDGSQTLTTPKDANGQATSVTIEGSDGTKVSVASTQNGQDGSSRDYANIDPATVKLDPNGKITMDTVVSAGYGGHDSQREGVIEIGGQDHYRSGTVKIEPNGQETTIVGADGTHDGDVTAVRNHFGGDLTSFQQLVNGEQVSLLGSDGKPLPGLSADGAMLHSHDPKVEVDPSTGEKSYSTADGVRVSLDKDGSPKKYNAEGFSFERHDDGDWYYHQDGEGNEYVPIDEPKMNDDGSVHTNENGFFNNGRSHDLNGAGQETGGSVADVAAAFGRNFGHSLVDDTISSVTKPIGSMFGQDWETHIFKETDPSNSSNAERIAAGLGSISSYFVPGLGEVKGVSKLQQLGEIASKVTKDVAKNTGRNAREDAREGESLNPVSDWNWYNWAFN